MSQPVASPAPVVPPAPANGSPAAGKPKTDGAAVREIDQALAAVHRRAQEIRSAPEQHKPKLVVSDQVRGTSILDKIADVVNKFCGQN